MILVFEFGKIYPPTKIIFCSVNFYVKLDAQLRTAGLAKSVN
jgi:hypothetical protein